MIINNTKFLGVVENTKNYKKRNEAKLKNKQSKKENGRKHK